MAAVSGAAALLRLRLRATRRAVREHAATLFVLAPLMGGVGLLLLVRIAGDLRAYASAAALEAGVWGMAGVAAALTAVRVSRSGAMDLVPTVPLSPVAVRLDRYLAAAVRLVPLAVGLAALVAALGGGSARWGGWVALLLATPMLSWLRVVPGRWHGHGIPLAAAAARGAAALVPRSLRPHLRRDLILVLRGGVPRGGIHVAVFALAMLVTGERAVTSGMAGAPAASVAVLVAAWALAAQVSSLFMAQRHDLWLEVDAGVAARTVWRAKVALAVVLGTLAGGLAVPVWWPLLPAADLARFPLLGAAVGAAVGAVLMEGDGRPLLHGIVSATLSLAVGAAVLWHTGLVVAVPILVGYLESLGVPRLERVLRTGTDIG